MELIIEEISRGKKLLGRHKFTTDEVNIGRGYNNSIIIADPHVCAEHLSLKVIDGQWFVQDLQSINGSVIGHKTALTEWQVVNSGDIIQIGKTQLRFMLPDHPVAQSVKFNAVENLVESLSRWPVVVSMLVLFTALTVLFMYLNTPTKDINYNSLVLWGLALTLGYSIWPMFCSLMAHLNKHESRVGTQLGVSFVIINLFWLLDFVEVFLDFNISSHWSWQWLILLVAIALTFMLFWFNFYIAFTQTPKRRIKQAAGLTSLLFASLFIYDLSNQPEFKAYPEYNSTIMSPIFAVASMSSPEEFIKSSDELFNSVDELAKEK